MAEVVDLKSTASKRPRTDSRRQSSLDEGYEEGFDVTTHANAAKRRKETDPTSIKGNNTEVDESDLEVDQQYGSSVAEQEHTLVPKAGHSTEANNTILSSTEQQANIEKDKDAELLLFSHQGEDSDDDSSSDSDSNSLSGGSEAGWRPIAGPMAWVERQMMKGEDPRGVLESILPDGQSSQIPSDIDDITLWKIIINIVSEPPMRPKLKDYNTFDDAVNLIRNSKKIVVLTGAGVSVSCGIPDFRSRDGIYARLAIEYPDLPDPQAMFDIKYFLHNQKPFFKFAKEIYPGQFEPSLSHKFIKQIENHGKLLRNYTQNIDTLEQVAGISNVVQCHGSFAMATCMNCKYKVNAEAIKEDIMNQVIPRCPECPADTELNIMKPDIVFFGESLPEEFHRQMELDKEECDLLIVVGSSLKVRPVALIPNSIPASVPQILINREPLTHLHFDIELLGDGDVIINELAQHLGNSWVVDPSCPPLTEITKGNLLTPPLSCDSNSYPGNSNDNSCSIFPSTSNDAITNRTESADLNENTVNLNQQSPTSAITSSHCVSIITPAIESTEANHVDNTKSHLTKASTEQIETFLKDSKTESNLPEENTSQTDQITEKDHSVTENSELKSESCSSLEGIVKTGSLDKQLITGCGPSGLGPSEPGYSSILAGDTFVSKGPRSSEVIIECDQSSSNVADSSESTEQDNSNKPEVKDALMLPTDKPAVEDASVLPIDKPEVAEDASMLPTDKPEVAGDASMLPTDKPEVAGDASMLPTDKPEVAGDASMLPTDKPEVAGDASMLPTDKPEVAGDASMLPTDKPEVAGDASMLPTDKPEVAGDASMLPVDKLEVAGDASVLPIDKPEVAGDASMLPTDKPEVAGDASMLPIDKPEIAGDTGTSVIVENTQMMSKDTPALSQDTPGHSKEELELLKTFWQPKRWNLANMLADGQYLFLPPNRYIFKGAEVYESDNDDDDPSYHGNNQAESPDDLSDLEPELTMLPNLHQDTKTADIICHSNTRQDNDIVNVDIPASECPVEIGEITGSQHLPIKSDSLKNTSGTTIKTDCCHDS
ncbi:unnamed protein product [Owenia fusiformis]|uniref:protein acetyllysine N-acetyltransferase n=1 Tax=Owenia fusiformis TaxID=6347 RepID=A0A8J1UNL1_OWEFU|nr:unnamed protein product [Owenia fusiformis]